MDRKGTFFSTPSQATELNTTESSTLITEITRPTKLKQPPPTAASTPTAVAHMFSNKSKFAVQEHAASKQKPCSHTTVTVTGNESPDEVLRDTNSAESVKEDPNTQMVLSTMIMSRSTPNPPPNNLTMQTDGLNL
uniref:Flocculation protein FLO11-like n=1 Tax=Steinernema glaseri TaxID=37863 RepID=A0A1I7Z0F7_9BILA